MGVRFDNIQYVEDSVRNCLLMQPQGLFDRRIRELPYHREGCVEPEGRYVKK